MAYLETGFTDVKASKIGREGSCESTMNTGENSGSGNKGV